MDSLKWGTSMSSLNLPLPKKKIIVLYPKRCSRPLIFSPARLRGKFVPYYRSYWTNKAVSENLTCPKYYVFSC